MLPLYVLWLFHITIAVWVVAPVAILGRKRARWERWELLAFIIPFWTWGALVASPLGVNKALGNATEAFYLSIAIAVATGIRVAVGPSSQKRLFSRGLFVALILFAVGTFFLVPRQDIAV